MTILLTGATGFLGFRTLDKLINIDSIDKIIATGRTLKKTHIIKHTKVDYVLGDLTIKKFVYELMNGIDCVIHAAALSSPWGNYKEFSAANLTTQSNLLQAAKSKSVSRYIYISTPSLYFELKDKYNIKESDPLPSKYVNAYAETKRLAEIELEQANIPYIIFRPRALIGRGDTVIMPRLIRAYDEGKLKIIGDGENITDLTSVANLVDAIILALNTDKGLNQTYNITNGAPVKLWDSINFLFNKLGKIPPSKKVPYGLIKIVAKAMEIKSKMTNMKEPTLTVYGVGILAKSMTMDISKAKALLGYKAKVSTEEAIEEFVDWYKEIEKD